MYLRVMVCLSKQFVQNLMSSTKSRSTKSVHPLLGYTFEPQQCDFLTSIDSDDPVQSLFKLRIPK